MGSFAKKLVKNTTGYLFLLPALLVYVIFMVYPILSNVCLSFTRWEGGLKAKEFIGLGNYIRAIKDPMVLLALSNNVIYVIGTTVGVVGLALLSAVLLWSGIKGMRLFRTIYFMPCVLSLVAVAIIWNWIYHPVFGILNEALRYIGLGFLARGWLGNSRTALPSVIGTKVWVGFGFSMVIFLAGLQNVNIELEDAARIDGANPWQRFLHVTLPQISHITTMVILLAVITGLNIFDLIFVMTGGGPANHTMVMAIYIYRQAFRFEAVGYGACLSVILTVIMLAVSVAFIRLRERGE